MCIRDSFYTDIKRRKNESRTYFLDRMQEKLNERMLRDDELDRMRSNFYTDIPELKYHLNNPMMERICQLKERDYRDKDEFDYAPQD